MKVYELIEKLMTIPAGCEVDFYDGAGTIYAVNKVNAPSDCASCAILMPDVDSGDPDD